MKQVCHQFYPLQISTSPMPQGLQTAYLALLFVYSISRGSASRYKHKENIVLYRGLTIQKSPSRKDGERIHLQAITDHLIDCLIYRLSVYSRVTVLRLDISPFSETFVISDYLRNLKKQLGRVDDIKRVDTFWVREISERSGEHYHLVVILNDRFQNATEAREAVRTHASKLMEKMQGKYTETYDSRIKCDGYFRLDRKDITLEARHRQKKELEEALATKTSSPYLNIAKIWSRKHHNKEVIGGCFDECVYAISYLSKLVSKIDNNTLVKGNSRRKRYSYTHWWLDGKKDNPKRIAEEKQIRAHIFPAEITNVS